MLFEFRKGSNATVAAKNIYDVFQVYQTFANTKCGFLSSDPVILIFATRIDQEDEPHKIINNDGSRAEVEVNLCQTIRKLSNTLNQPWSTVQEHLHQIGKVRKQVFGSEENKANQSTTCHLLLQQHNTNGQIHVDDK